MGERKGRDVPDDFKETEFQTVAAFGAHAKIRKYKETGVFVAILGIFEMV
jgi:predicted RNA-binding protein